MGRPVVIVAIAVVSFTVFSITARAGRLPMMEDVSPEKPGKGTSEARATRPGDIEALRMEKRFGIGVTAAGPLAVFGVSAAVNVTEDVNVAIGYGTGVDYSTWMAECRYFLYSSWISPFIGAGIARWWTDGTREKQLGPAMIGRQLLRSGEDPARGFSMFLVYPAIGVQVTHPMGFALSAELEQMFRLFSMGNATYGGVSFHWYL